MREKENARLAQGSFIHKLIEEALFEFTSLRGDREGDPVAPSGMLIAASAPLNEELFVHHASPEGMPAVEQGNLAAVEADDVQDVPSQRPIVALGLVVLLVLAAAALAWFSGLLT